MPERKKYISNIFLIKVDEDNHRIAVDIHQMYYWNDNRININPDHPYWQDEVDNLSLDGGFVERCLWTPVLQFKDLNDLDVIRPTPTSSNGSPLPLNLQSRLMERLK